MVGAAQEAFLTFTRNSVHTLTGHTHTPDTCTHMLGPTCHSTQGLRCAAPSLEQTLISLHTLRKPWCPTRAVEHVGSDPPPLPSAVASPTRMQFTFVSFRVLLVATLVNAVFQWSHRRTGHQAGGMKSNGVFYLTQ